MLNINEVADKSNSNLINTRIIYDELLEITMQYSVHRILAG